MISLDGEADAVKAAERRATAAFAPVLEALVGELAMLRAPMSCAAQAGPSGPVAKRMVKAVRPWALAGRFVTPMAAVAGGVADHVLGAVLGEPVDDAVDARADTGPMHGLRRASVNNGGDIALRLAPSERYRVAICGDPRTGALMGELDVGSADRIGGIATSGRHGRSLCLGIADAVTVLARDAASADVAATLLAGAVDLPGSPHVGRAPARALDADSDLGDRPVTVDVAPLPRAARIAALERALPLARRGLERGWLVAACLTLQGEVRVVGDIAAPSVARGGPMDIGPA